MNRISLIKRKSLADMVGNSLLINLTQRNEYFQGLKDTSYFAPAEVFLVVIASELAEFFPFQNTSGVINDLAERNKNLYRLLKKIPINFWSSKKRRARKCWSRSPITSPFLCSSMH